MNVTDLVAADSFLACKKPGAEGKSSKFQDFLSKLHPLDDPNPPNGKAAFLSESILDSFEGNEFFNFLNGLGSDDFNALLDDSVALKAAMITFFPSPTEHHAVRQLFFHLVGKENPISEKLDKKDAAPDAKFTSTTDYTEVTKHFGDPIQLDINKDGLAPSAQLKNQMSIHSTQIPTQSPYQRLTDFAFQISNLLAPSPENTRPNQIQSCSNPHSMNPSLFTLTQSKSQGSDVSSSSSVDKEKASAETSISFRSTSDLVGAATHQPNSKADIVAPDQPDTGAGLKPLEQLNRSPDLPIGSYTNLSKHTPQEHPAENGLMESKVIKKAPAQLIKGDEQYGLNPKVGPLNPIPSETQEPLDSIGQPPQPKLTTNNVIEIESGRPSQNYTQPSANTFLSTQHTTGSERVGLNHNYIVPLSKTETFIDNAKTESRHPSRSYLDFSDNQGLSNLQKFSSKSEAWPQHYFEPLSRRETLEIATNNGEQAKSRLGKTNISEQLAPVFLQQSKSNSIFKPSFSVTKVEQVDLEINLAPQSDVGKTTLQTVLGSEKTHHPMMQQITPKLIDQLVIKGDGKIDIMLSPKDLGKVEFRFQSHDKSGLSIVILAERDETAALVRRHMDVLTKEFERLGYSDIDFSCDGQSDQQKSKNNPAKAREDIDTANQQQSQAQNGPITAYDYSLSTAVDIRL